jgi:hypothetical protein
MIPPDFALRRSLGEHPPLYAMQRPPQRHGQLALVLQDFIVLDAST